MLQDKFEFYVDYIIEKVIDGVIYFGVNCFKLGCVYLFIVNYCDIVMDLVFVNYVVYYVGLLILCIVIGDNLLQKFFVSDLMCLNKSFIVYCLLSGWCEKFVVYQMFFVYINYLICEDCQLVWIVQVEGWVKDGDDCIDLVIFKMFYMSCKDEFFVEMVCVLYFILVLISYEYDFCDLVKVCELYICVSIGEYCKVLGEDDVSIVLGIIGYKGCVYINFGVELEGEFSDVKQLVVELDWQIFGNYCLFLVYYLVYEMSENCDLDFVVFMVESLFGSEELEKVCKEWNCCLE